MTQQGISEDNILGIRIGMEKRDVLRLLEDSDILDMDDMKNGYTWVKCWIRPFGQRILCSICFKDGLVVEIDLYPYINEISCDESWADASEEQMEKDKVFCESWIKKYKTQLPDNAEVCVDRRSLSAGIIIR
ncbi:hypothetical protein [Butyrivibrio sp. MB2005]|uniref:hypothetical protein n=1 Tax=Butyrivibrio sp. MB2005 TaxID=1280678 RepID=UPI0003F5E84C|nr:hypothetical protein [Butyrivibrio sp. MB2005]